MYVITFRHFRTVRHAKSVPGTGETETTHSTVEQTLTRYVIGDSHQAAQDLALAALEIDFSHDKGFEYVCADSVEPIKGIIHVHRRIV